MGRRRVLLAATGIVVRFKGLDGRRPRRFRPQPGRDHRPYRAEQIRQDDAAQRHLGRAAADRRQPPSRRSAMVADGFARGCTPRHPAHLPEHPPAGGPDRARNGGGGGHVDGDGDRREAAMAAFDELGLLQYRDRLATRSSPMACRGGSRLRARSSGGCSSCSSTSRLPVSITYSRRIVETVVGIRDRRGCGIILIDHDLNVILKACDRVVVLNEGRVIARGTPEEVRHDPAVIRAYPG